MIVSDHGNYGNKAESEFKSNYGDSNSDDENIGFVYFISPRFKSYPKFFNYDVENLNIPFNEAAYKPTTQDSKDGTKAAPKPRRIFPEITIERISPMISFLTKGISNPLLSQQSNFLLQEQEEVISRYSSYRMREAQL